MFLFYFFLGFVLAQTSMAGAFLNLRTLQMLWCLVPGAWCLAHTSFVLLLFTVCSLYTNRAMIYCCSVHTLQRTDGFTPGLTCRPDLHVESIRAEFRSEMKINAGIQCLLTWRQESVFNSLLIAWVGVCLVNLTALYLESYLPTVCNRPFIRTPLLESSNVWEVE